MSFEDSLKSVMDSLVSGFDKETIEDNQEIFKKLQTIHNENPKHFFNAIESSYHTFSTLVENVINLPPSDNQYLLEHIVSGLYKHFHTQRTEKLEGSACSVDKSSFIEQMTLKALKTQQNLSLYDDYQHVEQIKEDKERQAYWSPKSIKDTNEAMELFWNWYLLRE